MNYNNNNNNATATPAPKANIYNERREETSSSTQFSFQYIILYIHRLVAEEPFFFWGKIKTFYACHRLSRTIYYCNIIVDILIRYYTYKSHTHTHIRVHVTLHARSYFCSGDQIRVTVADKNCNFLFLTTTPMPALRLSPSPPCAGGDTFFLSSSCYS